MTSELKTKKSSASLSSIRRSLASLMGPAVPSGWSSKERVILMPYYTERKREYQLTAGLGTDTHINDHTYSLFVGGQGGHEYIGLVVDGEHHLSHPSLG